MSELVGKAFDAITRLLTVSAMTLALAAFMTYLWSSPA